MNNLINILCSLRIVFIHRLLVMYAAPHISIVLTVLIFLPRMVHFIIFCYLEMIIGELLSLFWTECIFNKFIVYKYYHIVISPFTIHIRKAATAIWMHIDILLWYIYINSFVPMMDFFLEDVNVLSMFPRKTIYKESAFKFDYVNQVKDH